MASAQVVPQLIGSLLNKKTQAIWIPSLGLGSKAVPTRLAR
jgi:hypothetical protein